MSCGGRQEQLHWLRLDVRRSPAKIWGVADKPGSLDVGKTANVVVANRDPLEVKTDVKQAYIEGRPVPMTSRQV